MKRTLTIALVLGVGALLPLWVYPLFLVKVLCFVLAACAFNLLLGGAGLLSLGHAAFFGGASYACGHLLTVWALPFPLATLLATIASGLLGLVFGSLAIKREGLYFSMVTLALAQFCYFAYTQAPFTGGDNGLQGVPRGLIFGLDLASDKTLYYVCGSIVALALGFIHLLTHSPFGESMRMIKSNEARAVSLGFDVYRIKLIVFVLSATLCGLAGALKVTAVQFASLTDAHFEMSGDILMMAIIGGSGSMAGAALGAVFVIGLQEHLAGLGGWIQAILGSIFAVTVLFFPGGLLGMLAQMIRGISGLGRSFHPLSPKTKRSQT